MTSLSATSNYALRSCPQCAGLAVQTIHEGRFVLPEGHPLESMVRVVACEYCGACFNDTASTWQDYDRYYCNISKYADLRLSSGSGSSLEDSRRLAETAGTIRDLAGATTGRILDIGCGAGGLLDGLAANGFKTLFGMDPAPACAAEVTRRGHRGVVGTINHHPFGRNQAFDGVVLSHVLEHIRDVEVALANVRDLLKPDGWLYVEVPDAARYCECLIAPFQDFNLEHINHFSAGSLRNLIMANGWHVAYQAGKTIDLGYGREYPATYAFARPALPVNFSEPDPTLRAMLESYAARSAQSMLAIKRLIDAEVRTGKFVVWGAGQFTMRFLGEYPTQIQQIAAIVDSNPVHHGRMIAGRRILAPSELNGRIAAEIPIVICSLVSRESIEAQIRTQGLSNRVIRLSLEAE